MTTIRRGLQLITTLDVAANTTGAVVELEQGGVSKQISAASLGGTGPAGPAGASGADGATLFSNVFLVMGG